MQLLNQPLTIGKHNLATRIVMPPMATRKVDEDGFANQAMADYYGARSKAGGFGLIQTEHHYVSADGRANMHQPSCSRDGDVAALALTAAAVHEGGTPVMLQINHAGSAASSLVTASSPVGPSAVENPLFRKDAETPRVMTQEDIALVIDSFARAARRAMEAGYDGVEVHAAHGYLLDQFWSPLTNRRADSYGGSVEGRARLMVEATRAVREAIGPEALLSVRLGACDYLPGAATIEDATVAARMVEDAGADLISVSGGMCGYMRPGHREAGWFADVSTAIRGAVDIPVLLTGGVKTAEDAESLLAAGACDLVGVGRAVMRDATWASRALA